MRLEFISWTKMFDGAAAATLMAAVGFAAAALAGPLPAALLASMAFFVAFVGLGQVQGRPVHRLAQFELQALHVPGIAHAAVQAGEKVVNLFDPLRSAVVPRASRSAVVPGGDAALALHDALAQLKRSLR